MWWDHLENLQGSFEGQKNGTATLSCSINVGDFFFLSACRECHRGGIAPGWRIVHKNHVTVDNRLDNLELIRCKGMEPLICQMEDEHSGCHTKNRESSLYWITVTQLLGDPQEMVCSVTSFVIS